MKSGNIFCQNCIYIKDLGSAGHLCYHPSSYVEVPTPKTAIHPSTITKKFKLIKCTQKNRLNDCTDFKAIQVNNWWEMIKAHF